MSFSKDIFLVVCSKRHLRMVSPGNFCQKNASVLLRRLSHLNPRSRRGRGAATIRRRGKGARPAVHKGPGRRGKGTGWRRHTKVRPAAGEGALQGAPGRARRSLSSPARQVGSSIDGAIQGPVGGGRRAPLGAMRGALGRARRSPSSPMRQAGSSIDAPLFLHTLARPPVHRSSSTGQGSWPPWSASRQGAMGRRRRSDGTSFFYFFNKQEKIIYDRQ